MDIKIEKMTNQDLDLIANILISDFDDFWNYNILKQELSSKNSAYFVAKNESNDIIGFAGIQFIIDEADITNIVTKKDFRKQGVGSALLNHLLVLSKQKNMSCVTLEVNEKNFNAIKLYNKFNFEVIGIRKKYYNGIDNAIIMKIALNNK